MDFNEESKNSLSPVRIPLVCLMKNLKMIVSSVRSVIPILSVAYKGCDGGKSLLLVAIVLRAVIRVVTIAGRIGILPLVHVTGLTVGIADGFNVAAAVEGSIV